MLPTLAVILFFLISPVNFDSNKVYLLISFVFITSYIIPLLLLIFFKRIKLISNFDIRTTNERKIPLIMFIVLCIIQGFTFYSIPSLKILSIIFWGSVLALFIAYLLIFLDFKISLHLIGMSGFTTYFIILNQYLKTDLILFIAFLFFLIGLLATARLVVKAHTPIELIVGFICGSGGIILATKFILFN